MIINLCEQCWHVDRDLPQDFHDLMPREAARHFYRAAISPVLPPCQVTPRHSIVESAAEQKPAMEQLYEMLQGSGKMDEAMKMEENLSAGAPGMEALFRQMKLMKMAQEAGGGASGGSAGDIPRRPAATGPAAAKPPPAPGGSGRACAACGSTDNGNGGLKSCGRCHKVWYCGQACQRADWAMHKKSCGPQK